MTLSGTNNLKINEPSQLTAVAKDASGNVLTGKTFSFTSSNPDVVTVDANGNVTANRLTSDNTPVTITASVDGKTSNQFNVTTYGLEFAVGTFNRSALGMSNTFAHFVKLRLPDGSFPPAGSGLDITGPGDWNGGVPDTGLTINRGTAQSAIGLNTNPATPGIYNASTTIAGQTYTASATLDASSLLPPVTNVQVTNVTASDVTVTWSPAVGAAMYIPFIVDCGTTVNPTPAMCTTTVLATLPTGTSANFTGLSLNPTHTYAVLIRAVNVNTREANPATPPQLKVSQNGVFFRLP
ncbi:fibronectin type III domain-containing protein [Deinococcus yavapaiensis]|uniref:fibronectin type III domain-containing protein n=1 Tax=Deinococcus yavapaiensis TaxID=309889 RepID=UPI0014753F3D|nr:fibronectin type III domain-containing protein [Deinococcus yavapaiensis]